MATRIERRRYKFLKATSKKMIYGPFECPRCGTELYFRLDAESKRMRAKCACGVEGSWEYSPLFRPIDYYNKLADQLRAAK